MRLLASPRIFFTQFALFALLFASVTFFSSHSQVFAQEDGQAAAPVAEAAPAEPATENPTESSEAGHSRNALFWIIESSGWIGAIILMFSIYLVAKVFQQMSELQVQNIAPPALIEQADDLLKVKDFPGVYRLVKADETVLGELLTAGLTELPHGLGEAREAMDLTADRRVAQMEKEIAMLAVIGTLGPMIGLLGTLKGMITAFSVIALQDAQLKASDVAGAISEALILTFEGVALSLPAIFFYSLLKNRINAFTAEAVLMADTFMRRLNIQYRSGGTRQSDEQSA